MPVSVRERRADATATAIEIYAPDTVALGRPPAELLDELVAARGHILVLDQKTGKISIRDPIGEEDHQFVDNMALAKDIPGHWSILAEAEADVVYEDRWGQPYRDL